MCVKCTCVCVNTDFEEDGVLRWFKALIVTHRIIQMGLLGPSSLLYSFFLFFSRVEAKLDRTYLEPVSADEMADCARSCRGKKCYFSQK